MANHSLNRASGCNSLAIKCLYIAMKAPKVLQYA